MPRKPLGDRPLTAAERQARQRERRSQVAAEWREALVRIVAAKTVRKARQIAQAALSENSP